MSTSSFAAPDMPTMRDALTNLDTQTHIPARKRRRWRQDALAACKWFGFKPEDLIANLANLNPRFRRLPRGTLGKRGVTKKRVSNVKHSVKCMVACLPSQNNRSFKAELSPPWARLAAVMPNRYRLTSVHCIMKFCSAQDILPADFDDEASARLLAALVAERLNGNPPITHQNAVRSSNWLKVNMVEWCVPKLTPPCYAKNYILPWSALPGWATAACRAFVERNTTTDPFDLSRPMKVWRPATVKTYLILLRRYFSMIVHARCDLNNATCLRDVANFKMAEPGLRWMTERLGNKRGYAMAANTAILLAQIALNPDSKAKLTDAEKAANAAVAAELQELASRLHSEKGLSGKNRERLAPLKDEANLAKLFLLPFGLEREIVKSRKTGRRLAILLQWAVALMILTFCPLRISTLCSISDRNLVWSRPGGRGDLTLELDASQLKGGEPASIPLPSECARVIRLYLKDYRHLLVRGQAQFLFPGAKASQSKGPGTMSTQLRRLIWDRLGLHVNPHLYRHIVHLVILRRFPGAYAMISRILTHKSLETAVRNYAYYDAELSMKAFHQLVREVQNGTSTQNTASLSSIAYNHTEFNNGSRKSK